MNPLDKVVQFIEDCRAAGVPDRLIYEGLQVAMVESAMLQMTEAEAKAPAKAKAARPVVGFVNSSR